MPKKKAKVSKTNKLHIQEYCSGDYSIGYTDKSYTSESDIFATAPFIGGNFVIVVKNTTGIPENTLCYVQYIIPKEDKNCNITEEYLEWASSSYKNWHLNGRKTSDKNKYSKVILQCKVIPFLDYNYKGHGMIANVLDFRVAKDEELNSVINTNKLLNVELKKDTFKPGNCVVINKDIVINKQFLFMSFPLPINKGTEGIIDFNPQMPDFINNSASDTKFKSIIDPSNDQETPKALPVAENKELGDSGYHLNDFIRPQLRIFFPDTNMYEMINPSNISIKEYDTEMINRVVLPNDYIPRILKTVSRVTNREVHETIYDKLNLNKICDKGRGSIIMLYGQAGTGKTMCAEAVANYLKLPLIKVHIGSMGDSNAITQQLKDAFHQANKYNGILLLDEVDVFIQKRGKHMFMDEMTSVFLRVLEYFNGIMFMTTNLIGNIDRAVFSRIHLTLGLPKLTQEQRRAIWNVMLNDEIKEQLRYSVKDHDTLLNELSKHDINGREIKTIIQNALTYAIDISGVSNEKLQSETPFIKWVSDRYLLNEAEFLANSRDELNRTIAEPE